MAKSKYSICFLFLFVVLSLAEAGQARSMPEIARASDEQPQILVLDTYPSGLPIPDSINRGILAALGGRGVSVGDIFIEHLDFARAPTSEHRTNTLNMLRHKLVGKPIGLIISIGSPASDFLVREGKNLFPDAAILSVISPNIDALSRRYNKVMNIPWQVDPAGTLSVALDLFPDTKRVFVVTGANDKILPFLDLARTAFKTWQGRLDFEYSNEMTYDQMLQRVGTLPKDTIVIYSPFFTDITGQSFVPAEVVAKICETASVPVFATLEEYLGRGVVGGSLLRTEDIGKNAGNIALDYLGGQLELGQPVKIFETAPRIEFDWRELSRWNAEISRLPKDRIIINRPLTLWGQYKDHVITVIIVFLCLGVLVFVLLLLNRRLKRVSDVATQNEARFRMLIEKVPVALVHMHMDGRNIFRNERFVKLFGYTEEIVPTVEAWWLRAYPDPVYRDQVMRTWEQAVEIASTNNKDIEAIEYLITCHSGEQRIVEVSGIVLEDEILVTFLDLTGKKREQEILESARAELAAIFNSISDAIVFVDVKRHIVRINPAFTKIFGYQLDEIAGQTTQLIYADPEDYLRQGEKRFNPDAKVNRPVFENNYRRNDGTTFPGDTMGVHVIDESGKLLGYIGVIHDISERKKAEEELIRTKAILQTAMDCSPAGIVIAEAPDGKLRYVNDAGLLIRSEDRQNVVNGIEIAEYVSSWQLLDLDGSPLRTDEVPLARAIMFGETCSRELIIRRAAGDDRIVLANAAPIKDDDGKVQAAIVIFTEITEQKIAAEEKSKLEKQLQQAQKIESIGQLAGGVAHDFNNMLGVILGRTELALMKSDSSNPIVADLKEIYTAANRSAELTRQLLTFARKDAIVPKMLDLNDAVASMLKMLQRLIGENIHLSWTPEPNLWAVKIDPSQLDQILTNLCVNARDAIAGIGKITIETQNCSIAESGQKSHPEGQPGDYIRLLVSDDGQGIDKENLNQIFEPFFTTKKFGQGTGLGLSTVYGAVKQNHGFIEVFSELDQGTTFHIYFPRKQGSVESVEETTAEALRRGTETVLLVEDDQMVLELVKTMLEESGYAVLDALTNDAAISIAKKHSGPIHLLLSDLVMPDMNGKDLRDILQAIRPKMEVIFMSGYSADIIAKQGVIEEGTHCLLKPFTFEALTSKVRDVLDQD
jgi:PAS domain S-box-containing protein